MLAHAVRSTRLYPAAVKVKSQPTRRTPRSLPFRSSPTPILALTILAEAGDLRHFAHHRQFLKFCGYDLSTQQSGQFRGTSRLSKHGNARLRYAFWRPRARDGCGRIRFGKNIPGISRAIRRTRIASPRPSAP